MVHAKNILVTVVVEGTKESRAIDDNRRIADLHGRY
jgi:hypothetical protein